MYKCSQETFYISTLCAVHLSDSTKSGVTSSSYS